MSTDPDEIREQIELTRTSLSEDVNSLADTVNPAHAAKRTAASARAAVTGTVSSAKDKVMGAAGAASGTASDTSSAASSRLSSAQARVRGQAAGNPLAVGLIALGAGWLIGSLLPATEPEQQAAVQVKDTAAPAVSGAAREVAADLKDSAQQAAQEVKSTAADAASTVKDEAASNAQDVRDQAQSARDTITS